MKSVDLSVGLIKSTSTLENILHSARVGYEAELLVKMAPQWEIKLSRKSLVPARGSVYPKGSVWLIGGKKMVARGGIDEGRRRLTLL
jgi:hypothetical protein